MTNVNGTLFLAADDGVSGYELWKSNGTAAGTTLVKDVYPGGVIGYHGGFYPNGSNPTQLTNVNGTLFFTTRAGELWKSDGTEAGTVFLVSHNNKSIRTTCNRVLWLEKGKLLMDGPTDEVLKAYEKETGK